MRARGWDAEGLEFAEAPAERARDLGFRVHVGPLETVDAPEGRFDLIVGWMVLEHLHHPVAALERLHSWAAPDAWLAVSVPNAAALEFRLFRDRWYALQLPTHLFHYTPATLRLLLERSGWRVERVLHQRSLANVMASTGYALADRHRLPRLAARLQAYPQAAGRLAIALHPVATGLAALGQTGRMTVWARRISAAGESEPPADPPT
jgi:2-polyprenyl-3-methyl-5-hydroxy-6-metoxy-1,4-benzoquinol methylase